MAKFIGFAIAVSACGVLGAAYLQNMYGFVLVFVLGAVMAPPLLSVFLVYEPIRWAQGATRPWRVAAAVPAISLILAYVGLLVPALPVVPEWARSNIGPPVLFGIWAWIAIAYVAVFASVLPSTARETRPTFP